MSPLAPSASLSVTETVTPPPEALPDHIGDPGCRPHDFRGWKVDAARRNLDAGEYDRPEALDGVLDPLALELGLDRQPARDWQAGDTAGLVTQGGRYEVRIVELVDRVVPSALVRITRVIHADPVSGLGRGAGGSWPLTALQVLSPSED
jgi:hypothetical protein